MTNRQAEATQQVRYPKRIRVPGFVSEEDVGLGEVVKRATSIVGVRPCGGCQRRAAALNRWITLTPRGQ